ncbi:MAG: hypothetical protein VX438_00325 [Planctomycetota bacterium]|nr:hypothetical protein [Planctomycetota bacterium]
MLIWLIAIIALLTIGSAIYSVYWAKKRREAMATLAETLQLDYKPGRDGGVASRFEFLNKLAKGSNRYASNAISGNYRGHSILVFDYHYETQSTNSKNHRKTHHHHFSFFILQMEHSFPELVISREGFFSKVAQWFGCDDIDFESAEFSKKFVVRCADKKFAYDICNPQMIDYLLDHQDLQVEIDKNCLALFFNHRLSVDSIHPNLDRLIQIRDFFPKHVFLDR